MTNFLLYSVDNLVSGTTLCDDNFNILIVRGTNELKNTDLCVCNNMVKQ